MATKNRKTEPTGVAPGPLDLFDRLKSLIKARDGNLTRDLLRKPGRFGLGQVPIAASPDSTTGMICGYCSTGCSLNIHLRDGVAINLTPSTDDPVNLGMACPKGWEALTVLDAPDRATDPLLKGTDGVRRPVAWDLAMTTMASRIKEVQAKHGPDSFAFLGTGQLPTEELALLGSVAKFGLGQVFVAMHDSSLNRLTYPSFDPYSRQPSSKGCAVTIRPSSV